MIEEKWYLEYQRSVHNAAKRKFETIKIQFKLEELHEDNILREAKELWDKIVSQEEARVRAPQEEYKRYDGLCGLYLTVKMWGGEIPNPHVVKVDETILKVL